MIRLTSSLCGPDHAAMDQFPAREHGSALAQAALMTARWAEGQRLHARLTALAAKPSEPRKAAPHARVPPSHSPTANRPTGPRTGTRRDAGGGRPWHPTPDHSI